MKIKKAKALLLSVVLGPAASATPGNTSGHRSDFPTQSLEVISLFRCFTYTLKFEKHYYREEEFQMAVTVVLDL